jgi:hypothetical protein
MHCLITVKLEVHDELPAEKPFSLRGLFRRGGRRKQSTPFNNSHGIGKTYAFDYSAIPAIVADAGKFAEDIQDAFAERDRAPWIRHGSRIYVAVAIGPASKLSKPDFAERSFEAEKLTAERLEAELSHYNTRETIERAREAEEEARQQTARLEKAIEDAMVLSADTAVRRPITFRPR